MNIVVDTRSWDLAAVEDVPLWGMLRIKKELGLSANDLQGLIDAVATSGGRVESTSDTDELFILALMLWMARMAAGDRISFEDACDFPVRKITIEMTEEEKASVAAQLQKHAEVETRPGVRPTSAGGVPATMSST